jgi:hypothetical protein
VCVGPNPQGEKLECLDPLTRVERSCVLLATDSAERIAIQGAPLHMLTNRSTTCRLLLTAGIVLMALPPAQAADAPALGVELNKLETFDKGCRAYVVINNTSEAAFQSIKLDLVLFQPDGVIARRFAVDLAPLKAAKKTVKLFDIDGLGCDKISSVLVNDVMECKSEAGPQADCLSKMSLSSVAGAPLTK